jgi:hypothetical protein
MTDRPALDEIEEPEVTSKMLSAASEVLLEYYFGNGRYDLSDEVIMKVYRAMERMEKSGL